MGPRLNYTIDPVPRSDPIPPGIKEILDGRLSTMKSSSAPPSIIIGKVNSLVSPAESHRVSETLKCIDIDKSALGKSAETPKNDLRTLKKTLDELP